MKTIYLKLIFFVVLVIIASLIFYAVGALSNATTNITKWNIEGRGFISFFYGISLLTITISTIVIERHTLKDMIN